MEDSNTSPVLFLARALEEYLDEHYPYWQGDSSKIPEDLVIEMHPYTQHMILRDPDRLHMEPGRIGKVWIPTKINLDLQPGEWALVMVTKDRKIGGMLP
jgi:hypothetical protein